MKILPINNLKNGRMIHKVAERIYFTVIFRMKRGGGRQSTNARYRAQPMKIMIEK